MEQKCLGQTAAVQLAGARNIINYFEHIHTQNKLFIGDVYCSYFVCARCMGEQERSERNGNTATKPPRINKDFH